MLAAPLMIIDGHCTRNVATLRPKICAEWIAISGALFMCAGLRAVNTGLS